MACRPNLDMVSSCMRHSFAIKMTQRLKSRLRFDSYIYTNTECHVIMVCDVESTASFMNCRLITTTCTRIISGPHSSYRLTGLPLPSAQFVNIHLVVSSDDKINYLIRDYEEKTNLKQVSCVMFVERIDIGDLRILCEISLTTFDAN